MVGEKTTEKEFSLKKYNLSNKTARVFNHNEVGVSSRIGSIDNNSLILEASNNCIKRAGGPQRLPHIQNVNYSFCEQIHSSRFYRDEIKSLIEKVVDNITIYFPNSHYNISIYLNDVSKKIENSLGKRAASMSISWGYELAIHIDKYTVHLKDLNVISSDCLILLIIEQLRDIKKKITINEKLISLENRNYRVILSPSFVFSLIKELSRFFTQIDRFDNLMRKHEIISKTNKLFSLSDNIQLDSKYCPKFIDDEGVERREISIIDKGQVKEPLLDTNTATQLGGVSNGSAIRDRFGNPKSKFSSLIVASGDTSLDDILGDPCEQLYLDYPQNIRISEDMSDLCITQSMAFLVKKSQFIGRIHNCSFNVDYSSFFKNLLYLSNKNHTIHGCFSSPHTVIDGLAIK